MQDVLLYAQLTTTQACIQQRVIGLQLSLWTSILNKYPFLLLVQVTHLHFYIRDLLFHVDYFLVDVLKCIGVNCLFVFNTLICLMLAHLS